VELIRPAAAAPDYCGPPLDVIERLAEVVAEVHDQVTRWHIGTVEEHTLRVRRPRTSTRQSRSIRTAVADLHGRG
jgi:hypothetical protein